MSTPNDSASATKKGKKKKQYHFYKKKPKEDEKLVIQKLRDQYDNIDSSSLVKFSDLPLSRKTLKGLKDNNFKTLTEIQRESIGFGLQGLDVLGAAKTGSGKTLAFLIPVLENLYCKQWSRLDGIGALIITPTRELAYQIFETLRKVGIHHDLSAGLIIGGKDLHFEKKRMDQCNIVICTPGRLLQHMDENPLFNCNTMQTLVLDEADRCLDMGFERTMNAIIENLPPTRQTLLFSATQTKSVRDLARLSLNDPMYVSVHEHSKHSTPENLQQSYVVCELHEKVNMLWSFIKAHLKQKILIFMSSCKQVKYHYDLFCRMRPGTSLLQLQGTLHQLKRMSIYESFCKKSNVVMFATDIAARGLDFPEVNWVVQMDCPEDANTYIHRAGRTARYQKGGESLLVLLPSEEHGMLEELKAKKIPINKIQVNPSKMSSPFRKIEALLAQNNTLKECAQRAFVAYIKSVFLMKNKKIFNVHALDTSAYSASLGLAMPPRIRFLQRFNKRIEEQSTVAKNKQQSNTHTEDLNVSALKTFSPAESSTDEEETEKNVIQNKAKSKSVSTFNFAVDIDSDDDVLKIKRHSHELQIEPAPEVFVEEKSQMKKPLTKAALAKKILHKKIIPNKKTIYDEEGQAVVDPAKEKVTDLAKEYEAENEGGIDIEKAKIMLREEDKVDKQRFREKLKAKRREEKRKLKKARKADVEEIDEEVEGAEEGTGSDEDNESDDGSGPDLSWLPDPDKVYKKNTSNDHSDIDMSSGSEEQFYKPQPQKRKNSNSSKKDMKKVKFEGKDQPSSGSEEQVHKSQPLKRKNSNSSNKDKKKLKYIDKDQLSSDSEEQFHKPQPLKRKHSHSNNKDKKKLKFKESDQPLDTGLSLLEDEELALQFLKHSK